MVLTAELQGEEASHKFARRKADILPFPGQKERDRLSGRLGSVPEYYCVKIDVSMLGQDALDVYCSAIDHFRTSTCYQDLDDLLSQVAMETGYALVKVEQYVRRRDKIRPYEVLLWAKPVFFTSHRSVDVPKQEKEARSYKKE